MLGYIAAKSVAALFSICELLIVVNAFASWLPFLWQSGNMYKIMNVINSVTEPLVKPVRSLLAKTPAGDLPIDISPVVTILLLNALQQVAVRIIIMVM